MTIFLKGITPCLAHWSKRYWKYFCTSWWLRFLVLDIHHWSAWQFSLVSLDLGSQELWMLLLLPSGAATAHVTHTSSFSFAPSICRGRDNHEVRLEATYIWRNGQEDWPWPHEGCHPFQSSGCYIQAAQLVPTSRSWEPPAQQIIIKQITASSRNSFTLEDYVLKKILERCDPKYAIIRH